MGLDSPDSYSHSHRNIGLTFREIYEKILRFANIPGYPNEFSGLLDSRDMGYPIGPGVGLLLDRIIQCTCRPTGCDCA